MGAKQAVVITGVSSGIGLAAVEAMAADGFHVFGTVRKQADADRLVELIGDAFTPLLLDVTDRDALIKAADTVAAYLDGRTLSGLVNNAGIATGGPLLHQPIDTFRAHLEVNIIGVVNAAQAFGPLLGADTNRNGKPGRIINIGSVGGRHAFPFMSAYHTTKYGLEGLTESLRRELLPFGIDAILLAPGSVASNIWDKADAADYSMYEGTSYADTVSKMLRTSKKLGEKGLPPAAIGKAIHKALTVEKPKTYYRVTPSPLEFFALTRLPKRMVDRIVGKQLGLLPR